MRCSTGDNGRRSSARTSQNVDQRVRRSFVGLGVSSSAAPAGTCFNWALLTVTSSIVCAVGDCRRKVQCETVVVDGENAYVFSWLEILSVAPFLV